MIALIVSTIAFAQATVVALGDGLTGEVRSAASSGWVTVLADCLEERAPRAWTVVDRASDGQTIAATLAKAASVDEIGPRVVVVGLNSREMAGPDVEIARRQEEIGGLVRALRHGRTPPNVLLVGPLPLVPGPPPAEEAVQLQARATEWNQALSAFAAGLEGVRHVDLQAEWPQDASALVTAEARLTDQGHARVAAAVCDAVLATSSPE